MEVDEGARNLQYYYEHFDDFRAAVFGFFAVLFYASVELVNRSVIEKSG
jgi:hypothetical protein